MKERALTYVTVGLLLVAILLMGVTISRQSGAPTATREVLCIGIVGNPANAASLDPRVLELCADVGVTPKEGP